MFDKFVNKCVRITLYTDYHGLKKTSSMRLISTTLLQQMKKAIAGKSKQDSTRMNEDPIIEGRDGTVTLRILAKPGAKQNRISGISNEGIGVQISAPPVDGEANIELVKFIAKILGLRQSDIILDRGSKSRTKNVIVTGKDKAQITQTLQAQIGQ